MTVIVFLPNKVIIIIIIIVIIIIIIIIIIDPLEADMEGTWIIVK